jgi:hypothetical protein
MTRSKLTEEQTIAILRAHEAGTRIPNRTKFNEGLLPQAGQHRGSQQAPRA